MTLLEISPSKEAPALLDTTPPFQPVLVRSMVPKEVEGRHDSLTVPSRPRRWLATASVGLVAFFCFLPVVWMYFTSFRNPGNLFAGLFDFDPSLANYSSALSSLPFVHLLLNTIAMAVAVSAAQLVTSLLASYAFARWHFPFERLLFFVFVATWLVPFQVTMLPNYVLLAHLGLLNSIASVIVPQTSSAFGILLLRQHLKSFPTEILDASSIDGRTSWSTLWRIVVPNLGPALFALAILLFVSSWNEYFWPLLVFRTPNSVLQIGIANFLSADATNYGALMAAAGLATLPLLIMYIVLQRRVVDAFVRSGFR